MGITPPLRLRGQHSLGDWVIALSLRGRPPLSATYSALHLGSGPTFDYEWWATTSDYGWWAATVDSGWWAATFDYGWWAATFDYKWWATTCERAVGHHL